MNIKKIISCIHNDFSNKNKARDESLICTREIIRDSSTAIKCIHRDEKESAEKLLQKIQDQIDYLKKSLKKFPSIYFSGYIFDAQKEFAEAKIFYSIIYNGKIPSPKKINIENTSYLHGLGEVTGELRRYILNCIKWEKYEFVEKYFNVMEEIYYLLFEFDYPDNITGGLRRIVDAIRGIVERTHSDFVMSSVQNKVMKKLKLANNKKII